MQLKCNRFVFSYQSAPEEVENFIRRSANMAEQTYGRDAYFARLNQLIIQAKFLGWKLPNFGQTLPEEFAEIPPEGIDHIFENQCKLLVDVAPATRVLLENGSWCPVRMICGTTPAGDLIWKTHLLTDPEGCPYVQHGDKRYVVKTKGTKIVCQTDILPYDENYMMACFGGEAGYWPMPFLPEFFIDRPIAYLFSPENGVVEIVKIHEEQPVCVLARKLVPWYQQIELDRTKALTMDEYFPTEGFAPPAQPRPDLNDLISGWDDLQDDDQFSVDGGPAPAPHEFRGGPQAQSPRFEEEEEEEEDYGLLVNLITRFTPDEDKAFAEASREVMATKITSKAEADSYKDDPRNKERAASWLLHATTQQQLLHSHPNKIGALLDIIKKSKGERILVVEPSPKHAKALKTIFTKEKIRSNVFDPRKAEKQIPAFHAGKPAVLITTEPERRLLPEGVVIISVTATNPLRWLELCDVSNVVYTLPTEQLGYEDHNLVPEHELFAAEMETYKGPNYIPPPAPEPKPKSAAPKEKKEKFKVKSGKGRPKTVATYDKAMEVVRKLEQDGKKCEIYSTSGSEALYITGIGELN